MNSPKRLEGKAFGDESLVISGIAPLENAGLGDITFLANNKYVGWLDKTAASAVLLRERHRSKATAGIICNDPYLAFAQVIDLFFPETKDEPFISQTASIADTAKIGNLVTIDHHVSIGRGVKIADGCCLGVNVAVGDNVEIGQGTRIYPNVVIYDNCRIGNHVVIHSGTVIGSDGYGYVWDGL